MSKDKLFDRKRSISTKKQIFNLSKELKMIMNPIKVEQKHKKVDEYTKDTKDRSVSKDKVVYNGIKKRSTSKDKDKDIIGLSKELKSSKDLNKKEQKRSKKIND